MKQVSARVISNEQLWGEDRVHGHRKFLGTWLMWLKYPEIASEARPGQFVMINCGAECILPRPFGVHQVNDKGDIALLYAVLENGRGTGWLAQRKASDYVRLFGALGNGFSINPSSNNLLLVAGGNGIASLYFLAQEALRKKYSVTLLYGTADEKRFPVAPQINLVSVTEDGSLGRKGMVTDLLPEFATRTDQIFACGPMSMYHDMADKYHSLLKDKSVQVSLEVRMGCGLGVCYSCTVKTKKGLRQVCRDGPVFELNDILWQELKDVA